MGDVKGEVQGVPKGSKGFWVLVVSIKNEVVSLPVWSFVAVTAPLVLSPGASTAVVLRNSLAGGTRGGLFTAVGTNTGSVCYGVLTALGLSAALQRWPSAWLVLKWAGVAYLAWLGARSLVRAARHHAALAPPAGAGRSNAWSAAREGFATNVLNPSLTAFYLIVLPQFIPRGEPFARSALILTIIHVSMAFSWHAAWALAGGSLARMLSRTRARQALEALTGVALIALAINIAAS